MKSHGLALLLLSTIAVAETPNAVPPEVMTCTAISRSSERLACFDHVVAALAAGKPISDKGGSPESSFGILSSAGTPPAKADGAARAAMDSLSSTVKGFGRADDGSLVVHLENGQSWKQISGHDPLLKTGDAVTINRAALGSFQMVMPTGRSAKVRRIK
ncbi:MAG: hypothetical protein H7Y89_11655 [Steroidobacteraceae bacterium]|nr:hypothetical protein [Steroidobacteraceae bacterium]